MINESFYWKKELFKCFKIIATFRSLKRPSDLSYVKLEKAIMMGAFICRKLNESDKIPHAFFQDKVKIGKHPFKGDVIDKMNNHRLDEHYNFKILNQIEKKWEYVINQIIHSYTFCFCVDDLNRFEGILINSDSSKVKGVFILTLKNLLTFFLSISEGYVTKASYSRIPEENNEMRLISANYQYDEDFVLEKSIEESLNGNIYKRN